MRTEQDPLPQHERLARLLEELEQEFGPIDPQVIEEVRQAWPLPDSEDRDTRFSPPQL